MANVGWVQVTDLDFNQLESLRVGETLRFAHDPQGDPIAYVERNGVCVLDRLSNSLQCGLLDISELLACGIGVEFRSLSAVFPGALH